MSDALTFTGERFVPGVGGEIVYEHVHRYAYARRYADGKRVLDAACGEGYGSALLSREAATVVGVDDGAAAIAHARARYHAPNLAYVQGSVLALPLADASVDLVVSFETIEHLGEQREMLAEFRRVLAPDGVLILTAPFQFRLHEQPHDYFRYSAHGLRQLCDDAGLEVFETIAQGSLWSVVGHKLNSYLALRVARVGQLAQRMGKLPHEAPQGEGVRWWTLPVVGPGIVSIAAAARVLDRVLPDPDETLGFLVLARKR